MGDRANYVVIRDGLVAAYYDHYGASTCAFKLLSGPEKAAAVDLEPTTELMDWAWAEAGLLLDFDRRTAIIFGEPDIDPDALEMMPAALAAELEAAQAAVELGRQTYLEHVAPRFPGWILTWDERGVDAFVDHLRKHGLVNQLKTQPSSAPAVAAPISVVATIATLAPVIRYPGRTLLTTMTR